MNRTIAVLTWGSWEDVPHLEKLAIYRQEGERERIIEDFEDIQVLGVIYEDDDVIIC